MLCGIAGWVAGLLCACSVMLGPMGQPVDKKDNMSAVTPQIEGISREERTPTSLPNLDRESAFTVK
ncbi:hypothetical protein E3U43_021420, partial [Larimichthys crocea]